MNDTIRQIKYNGLDIIKFIMAIFIVMLHSSFLLDVSYNLNYLFQSGITRIGVPFFFVASGFLLYRKVDVNNIDFLIVKKYVFHILRLYIIWTIIYLPIIIYSAILRDDRGIVCALISFVHKTVISGSYIQLWFLQALIVSSCLVTLLFYFKFSVRKIFFIASLLYCIGLLGQPYYWIFNYFFPEGTTVYSIMEITSYIFLTPRNGFCFGFLFFYIGAYLACSHVKTKNIKYKFLISFILLLLEVMFGSFYGFNKAADMYVFLVPSAYYLFLYAKSLSLADRKLWLYLRKQSMYIFYIHTWFLFLVNAFFGTGKYSFFNIGRLGIFIVALMLSMIFGHIIIKLSKNTKYQYLRYLS